MNRFEVLDTLFVGGQGTIKEVVHRKTGIHYVMKTYLKPSLEAQREKEILSMNLCEGIPFLVDYIENGEETSLIMEKIEGVSLRDYLRKEGMLGEEEVVDFLLQIAVIIKNLHQHTPSLVYSDLKPENIIVTPRGRIKLVDFGSVIYPSERGMAITGTKPYVPEDEFCTKPYKDTYALGVIAYEMVTGQPFVREMSAVRANIHHVNDELQQIMQKAVSQRQENGFQDMEEMYKALQMIRLQEEKKNTSKKKKGNYFIMDCKRLYRSGVATSTMFVMLLSLSIGYFVAGYLFCMIQTKNIEKKAPIKDAYGRYVLVKSH